MPTPTRTCPACHTPLPDDAQFCPHCGVATPTELGIPSAAEAATESAVEKVRAALVDQYRIERVLGEGGMATVYLAEDLRHHRRVALKVMRPDLVASVGTDRFLREIEIAAGLSHPHILPVHDSGKASGVLYYVMPFVEGQSLGDRIEQEGGLPVGEALELARNVAEALAYAHARGIIHRDVKPANILLGAGHALVADFGVARAVKEGREALTQTGITVGTPQYMSPEQALGEADVDARTDVYAVGAVLYEMLAGEAAFRGSSAQAILAKTLTQPPPPLSTVRPGVPAAVAEVVTRAMARDAEARYQSASELVAALGAALDLTRSGVAPASPAPPSRVRVWGTFGAAAALSLAAVYGLTARWGAPRWTLAFAAVLLAIGAGVLVATGRAEARRLAGDAVGPLARWFTWRSAALGGALAAVLWIGVALALIFSGPGPAVAGAGAARLAVLPFQAPGHPDDAYFADGIADQVRGKLTELPGLQITARWSSEQYRDSEKSPETIGRELGVGFLLSATVRRAPGSGGVERVQVTPELIDAHTGAVTWEQTFDTKLIDVFDVQQTIATRVATALGIALGADEQQAIAAHPTDDLAAYDAYLRGEAITQSLVGSDPSQFRRAATYYTQAVGLDSTFGQAWARLANVRAVLYFVTVPTAADSEAARRALARAEAFAPDAPETYLAMSAVAQYVLHDPALAQQSADLGLAAHTDDVPLMRRVASFEVADAPEEALGVLRRTVRLDPRSVPSLGSLATVLMNLHRPEEARDAVVRGLELDPVNFRLIQIKVITYLQQGDLAGARRALTELPPDIDQARLAAYLATYLDMYWVLTDAQQRLLLTLPPSAFDNDRATWAAVRMETDWLRGDRTTARAYADTARVAYIGWNTPDDPQTHQLLGVALAYLGRYDEAINEALRGVELSGESVGNRTYGVHQLARVYALAGKPDLAVEQLAELVAMPYHVTRRWLGVDPAFASLRGNPQFERLVSGT